MHAPSGNEDTLSRQLCFTLSGVTTDLRSGDVALVTLEALWQMAYVFRRNGRDKLDVLLIAYQELDRVAGALSTEADRAIVVGGDGDFNRKDQYRILLTWRS